MTNYATTPEGVSILFGRFLVVLLGAFPADLVLSEGGQKVAIISALLASAVHYLFSFIHCATPRATSFILARSSPSDSFR